ncbi:glycoside hydrolase family 43 protein [Agromyces salentinus]|uniref:Glycoside hydrolase family 43 protein n=1 Tax=Agromyces salentinus TaxID=269421 RepID=A0ABP4YLV6_9MICO|nr:glycoside hydrolase family 43 protein [Agromyces salentinus]
MSGTAEVVPVVPGFHPDPSVCRVGEDYYLANSSFEYVPAVPIWHSRDLVRWTQIGNALVRDTQFPAGRARDSGGIYAPTLRHHDGWFWLITSDVGDAHGGQRLFRAADAAGPWSDAIELPELRGIDPDLCWTDDGECLVSYCSWSSGPSAIWQAAIDPETGRVLEEPRLLWTGTDLGHTEGPHLLRHGDWWYLVAAEGGTERGHGVSVARSRDPRGPFEAAPSTPVYSHRSTEHRVQNIGHADLVERPDGTWAAVHLGVRPRGMTPSFHVNGRETFLAEVDWVDDWPVFRPSEAVPPERAWDVDDAFDRLHPRWISPRARIETFANTVPGGLEVAAADGAGVYARLQAMHWGSVFELDPRRDAVVHAEVRFDDRNRVGVRIADGGATAVWTVGGRVVELGHVDAFDGRVEIASVPASAMGPDDLVLSAGGRALGTIDGRYLSTEVATGFTGRVAGVRVERGIALVRRISISEA